MATLLAIIIPNSRRPPRSPVFLFSGVTRWPCYAFVRGVWRGKHHRRHSLSSDDGWDSGPISFQDWCFIQNGETASELWRRALAPMGLELIVKAVDQLVGYGLISAEEKQSVSMECEGDLRLA